MKVVIVRFPQSCFRKMLLQSSKSTQISICSKIYTSKEDTESCKWFQYSSMPFFCRIDTRVLALPTHNALHSPTSSRSKWTSMLLFSTQSAEFLLYLSSTKNLKFYAPPVFCQFFPCGVKYQYFLTVLYRSCKIQYRDSTTVDGPQIKKASRIGEASSSLTLIACIVNHSMWRYSANRICALRYELWFQSDTEERREAAIGGIKQRKNRVFNENRTVVCSSHGWLEVCVTHTWHAGDY